MGSMESVAKATCCESFFPRENTAVKLWVQTKSD